MEFADVVRSRAMTRSFLPDPIDDAELHRMLEARLRAPSAGSARGVELLVLTTAVARASFWECISDASWRDESPAAKGLMAAPVIIVPLGDPSAYAARYHEKDKRASTLYHVPTTDWTVPYWTVDASFFAMTVLLAAADANLGALFFHLQRRDQHVLERFAVPPGHVTIGAIALGHRATTSAHTRSRSVAPRSSEAVIHREHW